MDFEFTVEKVPDDADTMMHTSEDPKDGRAVARLDIICNAQFQNQIGG